MMPAKRTRKTKAPDGSQIDEIVELLLNTIESTETTNPLIILEDIKAAQANDPFCVEITKLLSARGRGVVDKKAEGFILNESGILCDIFHTSPRVVIPDNMKEKFLKQIHNNTHHGVDKVFSKYR